MERMFSGIFFQERDLSTLHAPQKPGVCRHVCCWEDRICAPGPTHAPFCHRCARAERFDFPLLPHPRLILLCWLPLPLRDSLCLPPCFSKGHATPTYPNFS
ncbi:hypothetical protein CDAR_505511 [Caerostris darwini]|uniref:Uncharacterized protein n=1 Tax=Caerostris darwini TaxID=1538125 RepID=A0AAV4UPM8_9ARAC|nr:hypothetical protein CDAR_505511 [Caerostris darwini]